MSRDKHKMQAKVGPKEQLSVDRRAIEFRLRILISLI